MEVRTTVRKFFHDMTAHHISSDTRIRVIIDDPQFRPEAGSDDTLSLPLFTPTDQRQRLNKLTFEYGLQASDELIAIIEAFHLNTDLLDI
ncbi:MAG: hypothetical protein ACOYOE_08460 [Chlorobium sp.]